jgi:16S rRNA (guanine527-N7)-methyltransferase
MLSSMHYVSSWTERKGSAQMRGALRHGRAIKAKAISSARSKQKSRKMPTPVERLEAALEANANDFGVQLDGPAIKALGDYYELMLKWNERLHLVAPCPPEEFATRHVLESLLLLRHLPAQTRVNDVGSGAGLPIVPCLIVRRDLHAVLIESSQRKAVFLREALKQIGVENTTHVKAGRFEDMPAPGADYVTSRALDRFMSMLPKLVQWSPPNSTLLLFGGDDLRQQVEVLLSEVEVISVPHSERRMLLIAKPRL